MARMIERELVEPRSPAEWREWLAEHHATSHGVFLVVHKKGSDEPGVRYEEAVEEALCFGWIDSTAHTLDDKRYKQLFTPRKPGGTWAPSNKERVERLIGQGRMTEAGYAAIEAAKRNGSWDG
jgi:uncharacterized protein YdeI (YjbR/CyaY-like superfamily)